VKVTRFDPLSPGRLRRLQEEIAEELPMVAAHLDSSPAVYEELAYALHPPIHEGRVATYGVVVAPDTDPEEWTEGTGLRVHYRMARSLSNAATRRFADGISSWVLRSGGCDDTADEGSDDPTELVVFDRPAASERDLVVISEVSGGIIFQRHPSGSVRLVGPFGVVRATPGGWQHQPPVSKWLDAVDVCSTPAQRKVLWRLLRFAVHDLGSRRIGAILVHHLKPADPARYENRLPAPPALDVRQPVNLAPLQHVLSQIDGATLFDDEGTLTALGVRLVPTRTAEEAVGAIGGTRHTNARRYSHDEPDAVVIAVSEDGPVTVFRNGRIIGRSEEGERVE
jgi:hypothetical protein